MICGAILAGGRSSRMGGEPKAGVTLADGRTMAEHVLDALRPLCHEIVVLGHGAGVPANLALRRVEDVRPGAGPVAGVEALLASQLCDSYLVCACDAPRLTPELLARLLQSDATAAVFRRPDGIVEPLPLAIRAAAAPEVGRYLDAGRRSVHGLLAALDAAEIDVDADDAERVRSVNSREELRALR